MKNFSYRVAKGLLRRLRILHSKWNNSGNEIIGSVVSQHESQCFDPVWYREKYSGHLAQEEDAWNHYLNFGWRLKFDPCEFFWGEWYLHKNPDVAEASMNPLLHFEYSGAAEFRNPSPLFDTRWYTRAYNVDSKVINPLAHFLRYGRLEGYQPCSDLAIKSFIQGSTYGGHASIELDHIEWKLEHEGQSALYQAPLCTGRAYFASKDIEVKEQPFLENIAHEMRGQGVIYAELPYSISLDDVVVIPGTTYLAKDKIIINDEIAVSPETSSLKLWDRTWRRGDNILLEYTVGLNPRIVTGIHLFKEYEQNYFHFVAEVLPKLLSYEKLGLDVSIPLLVSSDLDDRLYELIDMFKHPQRRVLRLERNVPYLIGKLFYISDLSLVRDVYDRKPVTSDTYLPEELLNTIAKHGLNKRVGALDNRRPRKLFITRQGKRRKIVNEQEIVDVLIRQGFEVVDLSSLSVQSQIELFSSAEIIVGGTGAGFTNLLWCRPGTKAVILYPDHPYNNTTFWDRIAAARQLNVNYIDGVRANVVTDKYAMHDDFTIELRQLTGVL